MPENNPLVERINELAKLAKKRGLTPEEAAERETLRAEYLKNFRQGFRRQLDNTFVEQDDGSKVPLRDWQETHNTDANRASEPEE